MESTTLAAVVETARTVAGASARNDKVAALAGLLGKVAPSEAPIVVGLLTGEIRQGRIGVGWAAIRDLDAAPSAVSSLRVLDVDRAMDDVAEISGPGSKAARAQRLGALMSAATEAEGHFLGTVLTGGLRQGALDGVMVTAIAKAAGVSVASVRRALMMNGDLGGTAEIAISDGKAGLEAVGLEVGRGVQPMLASTSGSVTEAIEDIGASFVQTKLDGIRLQAHRRGNDVWLYTRNLNDVTERLPGVCELVRSLDVQSVVLDGELVGVHGDTPEMFQDTASTFSSGGEGAGVELAVSFFDILHRDGEDLVDLSLSDRLTSLEALVGPAMVAGIATSNPTEGEAFASDAVARGHEGVMVKGAESTYTAGRRGKTWRKVKPVYTFDLVVLGVEWGHGRRTGKLSNLHLGARRDGSNDEFVMVGKTFKGLTDELLAWQTEALLAAKTHEEGITVFVRPEFVIEIAVDGVQRSTTYPGALALRFARVKRYRPDKVPGEANTLSDLRTLQSL